MARQNSIDSKLSADSRANLKGDKDIITTIESNSSFESEKYDKNPFLDPKVEEYYRDLYTKSRYESYSAFDPTFEWSEEEEKVVVRKLNWRVAFTSCLLFVSLQVDRGNIHQAVSDNMLDDLGLDTNDYNMGNTIFLVSFLLAEVPSQLISKALGPDIFIPFQICAWSIVAMCQAALKGKASFFVTRFLIGALEGGFIADLVLWLSYFFTSKELPIRLSWFWTTLSLCQIATSLMAFGLLRINTWGWHGWQFLFLIEGGFTLAIGIASWFLMVPSAVQTKSKWNPKGWFTDREEKIVVNRILRDDPNKGSMNNRQAIGPKNLLKCFIDYDLWPIYAIGLVAYIGMGTFQSYFTLMNRQLGFSVFDTNLMTIPHSVLHIVFLLLISWFSERVGERSLVCLIAPFYATPLIAVIRWWPGAGKQIWPTWVLNTLYLGQPYIHAICVAWVSRNSNSVRNRSICSALYNMFVQLGNIIGNNIYREDDKPMYKRGNMQLFAITVILVPILLLTKAYYMWRNKKRDKIWNSMTEEEKHEYRASTKDEANKRLDFRFDH
ncbi:Major Facilitator Superfamily protein [Candida parapsilosis]|uniref:Major Facilitator Superfamily protein n=1 Tax=Candida parapsilosis TaxID=5480 RepID=A0A8X7NFA6_CANPA|nr:Major Facilitator Superfamily protein [Candida parapsilosis]KAF6042419.1 Major Facilitator Superfamily protein [Candida parapsilosis]KAF6042864.1 Major Facilitator Superfamily protein [Candida parapsilosis]KAF6058127.1 Major Facilitator Superfamily protein [Candida parapsilosis]KAI5903220.1 putative transporter [Candida parapsilosis]